jgi:DNA-binding NtrC family response regulator
MDADRKRTDESAFRILIVDDEAAIRRLFRGYLTGRGYAVTTAESGSRAVELVRDARFDLVLLDLRLPDLDGRVVLREIKLADPLVSVIIMTAFGSIGTAVEAMKGGAEDFLVKPLSLETVGPQVECIRMRRRHRLERPASAEAGACGKARGVVTRNPRMLAVMDLVAKVAPLRSTVLIEGESGTGKELIARAVHAQSPRAVCPFVAINCGAIPAHILESELFGHEKGSFTGAVSRRSGYFEAAAGGTLLLDEISEMSVDLQIKLLRVLQERSFRRVGGSQEIDADVRIVAATNRNLEQEAAEGRFRKDLYYRINVVRIQVPALRDRPEDISILSHHLLDLYSREFGKKVSRISRQVLDGFLQHRWEGNVRELENVVERAIAVCEGEEITLSDLPDDFRASLRVALAPAAARSFRQARQDWEMEYLASAIEEANGNVSLAARLTNIPRQNLYGKLERYGIDVAQYR